MEKEVLDLIINAIKDDNVDCLTLLLPDEYSLPCDTDLLDIVYEAASRCKFYSIRYICSLIHKARRYKIRIPRRNIGFMIISAGLDPYSPHHLKCAIEFAKWGFLISRGDIVWARRWYPWILNIYKMNPVYFNKSLPMPIIDDIYRIIAQPSVYQKNIPILNII